MVVDDVESGPLHLSLKTAAVTKVTLVAFCPAPTRAWTSDDQRCDRNRISAGTCVRFLKSISQMFILNNADINKV